MAKGHIEELQPQLIQLLETHAKRNNILDELSIAGRIRFMKFCQSVLNRTKSNINKKLNKSLSVSDHVIDFLTDATKHVHNLSSLQLTDKQIQALSLGLNFKIIQKKSDRTQIEAQFESLNEQLTNLTPTNEDNYNWLKNKLVDVAEGYARSPIIQKSILTEDHLKELKDLRSKKRVQFWNPIKALVQLYLTKQIISRRWNWSYKTPRSSNLINAIMLLLMLKRRSLDSSNCYSIMAWSKKMCTSGWNQSEPEYRRCTVSPKFTNQGLPLRPILAMCGSAFHDLARWLVHQLRPVTQSMKQYAVKDSFELVRQLTTWILQTQSCVPWMFSHYSLMCLFVKPLNIYVILSRKDDIKLNVPVDLLRPLISLCTENIPFTFQGQQYRQVDGVAMGSPSARYLPMFSCTKWNKSVLVRSVNCAFIEDMLMIHWWSCTQSQKRNVYWTNPTHQKSWWDNDTNDLPESHMDRFIYQFSQFYASFSQTSIGANSLPPCTWVVFPRSIGRTVELHFYDTAIQRIPWNFYTDT